VFALAQGLVQDDTPCDLQSWRCAVLSCYKPVGLASTLYKLWTRVVINTLHFAESKSLLSTTQAGFRKQKDTIHQLQNIIMALEDAKLLKQDVYALIVDFTSSFNTTDHDRLLWIMYDLGFPTDAVDFVGVCTMV
jgi:hypothetical protein